VCSVKKAGMHLSLAEFSGETGMDIMQNLYEISAGL
jgi:hypothetical protein